MSADKKGRWVRVSKGAPYGNNWEGPEEWTEVHGPATIVFERGYLERVKNCRMPDGTRRTVECRWTSASALFDKGWTARYEDADGEIRSGEIEVEVDDIRFIAEAALDEDLNASPRVRELVRDMAFAMRLYAALCNRRWYRRGYVWSCSFRTAGGIVAGLRASSLRELEDSRNWLSKLCRSVRARIAAPRRGLPDDDYRHFYVHAFQHPEYDVRVGHLSDDVARELGKLGWKSTVEWDDPDLEADLKASARIRELVRDRAFVERLFRALSHVIWLKDDRSWFCAAPDAGSLICELRGLGESLADFNDIADQGVIAEDIRTELAALGWTPKPRSSS